jgi:signal transduction histidine kinase
LDYQRSIESVIRRTASQPFRFKFSVLYIGITGIVAYLNGVSNCGRLLFFNTGMLIGGLLLILLGLEWVEQGVINKRKYKVYALVLLIARMALIEGIMLMDCNGIALLLLPMLPYNAHFAFGGAASTPLSLFYIMIVFWRSKLEGNILYLNPGSSSNLLAFTFVMLLVPLIANVIRRDDESRRRTEELLVDLEISHLKLQAYTEQVAELAAAEERNRLARDIHDSLGHYLTVVNIQLEKAIAYQQRDPAEVVQAIQDAKQAAADALRDVRHSVSTLRSNQGVFSLEAALEKLVETTNSDQLNIKLSIEGKGAGYPKSILTALYRAAQEGLTNIQKHAQASEAVLKVVLDETTAKMVLSDNGLGFDTQIMDQTSSSQPQAFGLRGIRERLELVRGSMTIQSTPKQGTVLTITVPKSPYMTNEPVEREPSWR